MSESRIWVQTRANENQNWFDSIGTDDRDFANRFMKREIESGMIARLVDKQYFLLDSGNSSNNSDCARNEISYGMSFDSSGRPVLKIYLNGILHDELYLPNLPTAANSITSRALWNAWASSL